MPRTSTFLTRLLASVAALALVSSDVRATPCLAFDADFTLYAFGFGEKDFSLGTQDKWSSTVKPTDITSTGRPPFDGSQTTCYLAQFFDAIYVLDGDRSNPTAVHIFDAKAKAWSTQAVSDGGPDPSSVVAVLDHDTNVFYALEAGTMSSLDMGSLTSANNTALTWNQVGNPPFSTSGYKPTMALAENHIHFLDVPQSQAGSANIFVIHFSFFQPDAQSYPTVGGGNPFPSTHGQAASFFKFPGVQEEFAFIPDDGSSTYVVNVQSNSTQALAGPSDKSSSTYAASISALVQLSSSGISFLPYTSGNADQSKAASWSKIDVQGLPAVSSGASGHSSANSTGSGNGGSGSGTATATGAGATGTKPASGNNSSASMMVAAWLTTLLGVVGTIALVMV